MSVKIIWRIFIWARIALSFWIGLLRRERNKITDSGPYVLHVTQDGGKKYLEKVEIDWLIDQATTAKNVDRQIVSMSIFLELAVDKIDTKLNSSKQR
jgi:hypothetical protein